MDQGAVLLVNQSAGEVKALPARFIHAFGVPQKMIETQPDTVRALVQALWDAQKLILTSQPQTVDAILKDIPGLERRHVERIVQIYAPAVPASPTISVKAFQDALAFFPATQPHKKL